VALRNLPTFSRNSKKIEKRVDIWSTLWYNRYIKRKEVRKMKYRVTNYTTLEIFETDNIATAYEWTSDWSAMNHKVEMVDNISGEVIVDTRRED
jgi:hypothetical protein